VLPDWHNTCIMKRGSFDATAWGGGDRLGVETILRPTVRLALPRVAVVWILGLTAGIVTGVLSLYVIGVGEPSSTIIVADQR